MKATDMAMMLALALATTASASAQEWSDKELALINKHRNQTISGFLNKQGFPGNINPETAALFAEKNGLPRDGRAFEAQASHCSNLNFFYVDVGDKHRAVEIRKTIALGSNAKGYSNAEYQTEWDKIFKKLGKPTYTEISRRAWEVGNIDFATYAINHNEWPVFVKFTLTFTGCLTASVDYSAEKNVKEWVGKAKEKAKPKPSAADAL